MPVIPCLAICVRTLAARHTATACLQMQLLIHPRKRTSWIKPSSLIYSLACPAALTLTRDAYRTATELHVDHIARQVVPLYISHTCVSGSSKGSPLSLALEPSSFRRARCYLPLVSRIGATNFTWKGRPQNVCGTRSVPWPLSAPCPAQQEACGRH